MKLTWKSILGLLAAVLLLAVGVGFWYVSSKLPQRSGELNLTQLSAPVSVRYDERGVPHIHAGNEADLYRALGYVHAQDRLFQMEMVRRLAQGELAEVLGADLVKVDRLFRTLRLREHSAKVAAALDSQSPAVQTQLAYLDGINQYQASHQAPIEFDLIGIPKRPFTLADTLAVSGYLAYSFASAFKTEPVLTYVRDELGEDYLQIFDLDWHPLGVFNLPRTAAAKPDWQALAQLAAVSREVQDLAGVPLFEGSNAWAVSGQRSASGKPLLAGDPHIGFSVPAIWYEAHLSAPGFELYGHFQALNSSALLGHNSQFGWSLTMFQNDDLDLITLRTNPNNPKQVRHLGKWVDLQTTQEIIQIKDAKPVTLNLHRAPQGPVITGAFSDSLGDQPLAMWWAFLETENPVLDAFYQLNRANTLPKAREAASKIHAPGLNIVWANASGDIGFWAAAQLPIRPAGVQPVFILDGEAAESDKLGFYRFSDNPQEENPPRGYIVSANQQPTPASGLPVPGYYNLYDRAQALEDRLADDKIKWDARNTQSLQLSTQTAYHKRVLKPLLSQLSEVVRDPLERTVLDGLAQWDGQYTPQNISPTVFTQFLYELTKAGLADELGEMQFNNLLGTRALDLALPRLAENAESVWWDNVKTTKVESRKDIVAIAWHASVAHLKLVLGDNSTDWGWGRAHTLTHKHPLASKKPLDWFFNVGPFQMPGGREVPNNQSTSIGPAPWKVAYGPSTRRIIDFAQPGQAPGINPVGQSGVLFDRHYKDQAAAYAVGGYVQQYLNEADVAAHTRSTLTLQPTKP